MKKIFTKKEELAQILNYLISMAMENSCSKKERDGIVKYAKPLRDLVNKFKDNV